MSSIASTLGLTAGAACHAPYYLLANFIFAHFILVPRYLKQYYGIDHNSAPRDDISKYGDAAIKSGKITQKQLDMIKRVTAAHFNRLENYPVFASAVVLAVVAGLDNAFVNRMGMLYTVSSAAYGITYALIETGGLSLLRTGCWYGGCWACVRLFWRAGGVLNGGMGV